MFCEDFTGDCVTCNAVGCPNYKEQMTNMHCATCHHNFADGEDYFEWGDIYCEDCWDKVVDKDIKKTARGDT